MILDLKRQGIASAFTPSDGIVQEWVTSKAVTNHRISLFMETIIRLSTSS